MESRRLTTQFFARSSRAAAGWIAIAFACLLSSGCELAGMRAEAQKPAAVTNVGDDSLKIYLDTMSSLASPDPARQADVFYEVEHDYTRAPTTASTLRYGIALVTPDHPASKPVEGKKVLESLLATPERLTPSERTLVAVVLHETNARLKLEAENRRLLATLDDRGRSQANSDKRVQAQIEDNARLRRALAEAQQKLDAIKEIERSIIERSPTPPGNRESSSSETQSSSTSR